MSYKGQAAGIQDLLNTIKAKTGYDSALCAKAWLKTEEVPTAACK